jgi:hypothetical protein
MSIQSESSSFAPQRQTEREQILDPLRPSSGSGTSATAAVAGHSDAPLPQTNQVFEHDLAKIIATLRQPEMLPIVTALASLLRPGPSPAEGRMFTLADPLSHQPLHTVKEVAALSGDTADTGFVETKHFKAKTRKIVANNLAMIVMLWTIIGCFLIYGADASNSPYSSYALFLIYSIVQAFLITFISIVTVRQVPRKDTTLQFLIQSWLALTLAFAGVYLFLQQALGVNITKDLDDTFYATAFGSSCVFKNSTSTAEPCVSLFRSNYDQVDLGSGVRI